MGKCTVLEGKSKTPAIPHSEKVQSFCLAGKTLGTKQELSTAESRSRLPASSYSPRGSKGWSLVGLGGRAGGGPVGPPWDLWFQALLVTLAQCSQYPGMGGGILSFPQRPFHTFINE